MKSIPTDPEDVYQALLRQTRGAGKGAQAVTRNRESILREWENFISLFLAPSRDNSLDEIDY
jgi:phytoene dehydrogenase-like protein